MRGENVILLRLLLSLTFSVIQISPACMCACAVIPKTKKKNS